MSSPAERLARALREIAECPWQGDAGYLQAMARKALAEHDASASAQGDWQHIANEWADCATNGVQCLRNVRDGIQTPEECITYLLAEFKHIRSMQHPTAPAAPTAGEGETNG